MSHGTPRHAVFSRLRIRASFVLVSGSFPSNVTKTIQCSHPVGLATVFSSSCRVVTNPEVSMDSIPYTRRNSVGCSGVRFLPKNACGLIAKPPN
jgi:hypothetical protein